MRGGGPAGDPGRGAPRQQPAVARAGGAQPAGRAARRAAAAPIRALEREVGSRQALDQALAAHLLRPPERERRRDQHGRQSRVRGGQLLEHEVLGHAGEAEAAPLAIVGEPGESLAVRLGQEVEHRRARSDRDRESPSGRAPGPRGRTSSSPNSRARSRHSCTSSMSSLLSSGGPNGWRPDDHRARPTVALRATAISRRSDARWKSYRRQSAPSLAPRRGARQDRRVLEVGDLHVEVETGLLPRHTEVVDVPARDRAASSGSRAWISSRIRWWCAARRSSSAGERMKRFSTGMRRSVIGVRVMTSAGLALISAMVRWNSSSRRFHSCEVLEVRCLRLEVLSSWAMSA